MAGPTWHRCDELLRKPLHDNVLALSVDKLPPECRSLAKRKLAQMEALERDAIVRSLEDNSNNKLQSAIALGMSRATIYRKMRDYGIA